MLHDVYFFGPLRVILETATGKIVGVQDRITGKAAAFAFSPDYIARACRAASMQWEACNDACV